MNKRPMFWSESEPEPRGTSDDWEAFARADSHAENVHVLAGDFAPVPVDTEAAVGRTVLAIGAHPDDVELGAGGALLAHVEAGDRVIVLTATRGELGGDAPMRLANAEAAADHLGAHRLVMGAMEDGGLTSERALVQFIEDTVDRYKPDVVYTHSVHDLHQDHRAVHEASMVACRRVAQVLCYESPSTTTDFRPNHFIDIGRHVDEKVSLIMCFDEQCAKRDYMTESRIRSTSEYWSKHAGAGAFEAFEVVRFVMSIVPTKTPNDDA